MTTPPNFKVGDHCIEVNYEVEVYCNGVKKTMFVDDYDAMSSDLSA